MEDTTEAMPTLGATEVKEKDSTHNGIVHQGDQMADFKENATDVRNLGIWQDIAEVKNHPPHHQYSPNHQINHQIIEIST